MSLRRNVPCEICNDDILYPMFCSNEQQGYVFCEPMSIDSTQRGDNHSVGVEIRGDVSAFLQRRGVFRRNRGAQRLAIGQRH